MNRFDLLLRSKIVSYLKEHEISPDPPGPAYDGLCMSAISGPFKVGCIYPWEYCLASDDPTDVSNWHDGPAANMETEDPEEMCPVLEVTSAIFCRSSYRVEYEYIWDIENPWFYFKGDNKVKLSGDISSMAGGNQGHAYSYCYALMFYYGAFFPYMGLTQCVQDASELIIPEVAEGSCYKMFAVDGELVDEPSKGSFLISAPQLPATTLAESCYRGMFEYCTRLQGTINLPATVMEELCYLDMFSWCGLANVTDPQDLDYSKALSVILPAPEVVSKDLLDSYSRMLSMAFIKDVYIACARTAYSDEIVDATLCLPFTLHCTEAHYDEWSYFPVYRGVPCTVIGDYNP